MLNKIKSKVEHSKLVGLLFKSRFYFELGETQIAKFIPDVSKYLIPLMFIKQQFDVQFSTTAMAAGVVIIIIMFTIAGFMYKNTGFYDAEIWTVWNKNPVGKESLTKIRDMHDVVVGGKKHASKDNAMVKRER